MPCYQMNLMNVEFIAANLDYLQMALRELGYEYVIETNGERLHFNGVEIDLANQRVKCERSSLYMVNRLKCEYSRQVIKEVAKRKRWVVKAQNTNKLKLRKF